MEVGWPKATLPPPTSFFNGCLRQPFWFSLTFFSFSTGCPRQPFCLFSSFPLILNWLPLAAILVLSATFCTITHYFLSTAAILFHYAAFSTGRMWQPFWLLSTAFGSLLPFPFPLQSCLCQPCSLFPPFLLFFLPHLLIFL